jgi:hypothetical protein
MQLTRSSALAALAASALAGSAATAISALADHGRHGRHGHDDSGLRSSLAPSVPADPALHGVAAGGAPWVLRAGEVRLRDDGRLRLRVRGLVIPTAPGNGTPGPVTTITASLYCGADTTMDAVGTSGSVPISRRGDARLSARFTLPAKCLAPVVLVHPNGNAAAYIAADGLNG